MAGISGQKRIIKNELSSIRLFIKNVRMLLVVDPLNKVIFSFMCAVFSLFTAEVMRYAFTRLLTDLKGIRYIVQSCKGGWNRVCGRWALGLIRGDKHYSYDRIDLAYDIDHVDEFLAWIKHARYEGKYRYSGGVRNYYSEKYGELRIYPCMFEPDGSAVLTKKDGNRLLPDEDFFEDVRILGKTIPCIAPGGADLIRELL